MNDLIYNYIISGLDRRLILSLHKNNHIKNIKKIITSPTIKITSKYIINELLKMECGNLKLLSELDDEQYISIPSDFWNLNIEDKNILVDGWKLTDRGHNKEVNDFIRFLDKIDDIAFTVFILKRFFKSGTDKNIKIESLRSTDKTINYNDFSESEKDLIYRNYRIYLCDKHMTSNFLMVEDLVHEYPVLYHYLKDEEALRLIDKNVRKVRTLETSLYHMFNSSLRDKKDSIYKIIEFIKNNIVKKGKISKKLFALSLELCVTFGNRFDLNMCYAIEQTLRCQNNLTTAMLKYLGINNKELENCLYEMCEANQVEFLNRILILKENCSRKTFARFKTFLGELTKEKSEGVLTVYGVVRYIIYNCSDLVWTRYFQYVDISSFEKEDFLDLFNENKKEEQLNLNEQYKYILKKIFNNEEQKVKLTKNDLAFWMRNKDVLIKLENKEITTYISTFITENKFMKKDKLYMKLGDILKINSFGIENNIDTSQVIKLLEFFKDKTIENERRLDNMQLDSNLFLTKTYLMLNNLGEHIKSLNDLKMYKVLQIFEGLEFVKNLETGDLIRFLYSDSNISRFLTSLDKLGLSDKFINKYESNIIDFITSKEMEITMEYFKQLNSVNAKNFALIIKAIIADKYNDIKWDRYDLSKEINSDITPKLFEQWKDNKKSIHGNIKIEECDDFQSIMTIGELPVYTCQSYISGSYNDCLLANFDSSKKILKIYKDGIQIGRAILRLTLCSDKEVISNKLVFKDIETSNIKEESNIDKIIFVEKMYSQLYSGELSQLCGKELVSFIAEKAKDINSKFAFASSYSWIDELKFRYYQIMISESKNGNQYIDSMYGESKRSSKYNWKNVKCYTAE